MRLVHVSIEDAPKVLKNRKLKFAELRQLGWGLRHEDIYVRRNSDRQSEKNQLRPPRAADVTYKFAPRSTLAFAGSRRRSFSFKEPAVVAKGNRYGSSVSCANGHDEAAVLLQPYT